MKHTTSSTRKSADQTTDLFLAMWQAPSVESAQHNAETAARLTGADAAYDLLVDYLGGPEDLQDAERAAAKFQANLPAIRALMIELQSRITVYGKTVV